MPPSLLVPCISLPLLGFLLSSPHTVSYRSCEKSRPGEPCGGREGPGVELRGHFIGMYALPPSPRLDLLARLLCATPAAAFPIDDHHHPASSSSNGRALPPPPPGLPQTLALAPPSSRGLSAAAGELLGRVEAFLYTVAEGDGPERSIMCALMSWVHQALHYIHCVLIILLHCCLLVRWMALESLILVIATRGRCQVQSSIQDL